MKAEIAVMTAEHIDMDAIARGGEILIWIRLSRRFRKKQGFWQKNTGRDR